MFYILENTRSSKILKVLIKCGFDLAKREPLTGNTALHFLFNPLSHHHHDYNSFIKKTRINSNVLDEYRVPHSLSKILFIMLKHGGLKVHVNTLNYERKLCIQVLFEWNELINICFYSNDRCMKQFNESNISSHSSSVQPAKANRDMKSRRLEWQQEFKECIRLLLKSGADLFIPNQDHDQPAGQESYINVIETLLKSILTHSRSNNETLDSHDHHYHPELSDFDDLNVSDLNGGGTGAANAINRIVINRSPSISLSPKRTVSNGHEASNQARVIGLSF
jgi:hypothetical protein